MRIISIEQLKNKNKRYRIRLDNGADFVLYPGELRRMGLEEDAELSDADYQAIRSDLLIPRAKSRALHLLEKQDRTEANLRRKLQEGGYSPDIIDEAINYVASYHYIDDRRYAENYIFYHKEKSRRRISQDLLAKGIDRGLVDEVLAESYESDERQLIAELLSKKHYDPSSADAKERGKMYRFLATRGFSPGDITEAMKGDPWD